MRPLREIAQVMTWFQGEAGMKEGPGEKLSSFLLTLDRILKMVVGWVRW
jgi:hypothetical protein